MNSFLARHDENIKGVLSGFDRVRFSGTLRWLANTRGLCAWLHHQKILLKQFKVYSMNITDTLREASNMVAERSGRPVEYLYSSRLRKEHYAREIARRDGITEGLVCVLTAVEPCKTFKVRKNRETKKLEMHSFEGKCLHHYFYLIDRQLGWLNVRLQTWFPFTVQIVINGREWLARRLQDKGIGFERREKANERYLEALSAADSDATLGDSTERICCRTSWKGRSVRALNPLSQTDAALLSAVKGRKGTGTHVLILMDGNQTPLGAVISPANNHESRHIERLLNSSVVELPAQCRLIYDAAADSDPLRERLTGACRTRQPMTWRQRNALVPLVGRRTTKRRVRLGTVLIRAAGLYRARQNQARLGAVRVGTATRNRTDTGFWFADVIVRATQWTMTNSAQRLARWSLCTARWFPGTSRRRPRQQGGHNDQHSETRSARLGPLRSRFRFHSRGSSKSSGTGCGAGTDSGAPGSAGPTGISSLLVTPVAGSRRISQPPPKAR